MAKKSKNTPRELDIKAVAEQLAQTAGIYPSLFPQIYDDALVQHAMEYQASQPQEARQMSPFAQATIHAAFAESPAVMTAAGWEHDADGNLAHTKFNSDEVAGLNESLAELASTAGGVALDAALPNIIAGINDLRLINATRKGAKYASGKQLPSLKQIKSALRSGDANEKAQVLGKIRAHLVPADIQVNRTMEAGKDGMYRTTPLREIHINPNSSNMEDAAKYGAAEVKKRAQYIGAHEGTHRVNDFRGFSHALDDKHLKVIKSDITGPLADELEKMPDVFEMKMFRGADGQLATELVDPRRLSSADEFVSNMTSAQMKAGIKRGQTHRIFEELPESTKKDIYNTMKDFYNRQVINGYNEGALLDSNYPFYSIENFAKAYNAAIGQGFAKGGYLNRPSQNTYGISPRVAAIVEKYGVDNLRNHFAGGGEFSREEDERQRLAEKKAEAIQRFRTWIPDVENATKEGYDRKTDRWYPHPSPEGGSWTIQYGLKLDTANPEMDELLRTQLDEKGKGYLTSEQADAFLDADIARRYDDAKAVYDAKRGKGHWDKLSPYSQSLLVDYQYNPGLSQFRNMMNGYDTGNKAQIQAEIGRIYTDSLGVRHPLKDRNEKMKLKTDSLETFYPIFDPFVVK